MAADVAAGGAELEVAQPDMSSAQRPATPMESSGGPVGRPE